MQFRTKDDLKAILGERESRTLEFKSSRPLVQDPNKARKFISDTVVRAVSSFLNSDGGVLIIGIEEDKDEKGAELSPGVPSSVMRRDTLQNMIVGMIQPPVGDLVSVRAIRVDDNDEEARFAFCVSVNPGNTAFQSADKLYYSRREGQSVAMDDKDIRLRMLGGDKPRIEISLDKEFNHPHLLPDVVSAVLWRLTIKNIGLKTITRALIRYELISDGLSENGAKLLATQKAEFITDFRHVNCDERGLMPTDRWSRQAFSLSTLALHDCSAKPSVRAGIEVLIDDGLPATMNFDVMEDVRPLIENRWRVTPVDTRYEG